ncbi:hypothetical protein ACIQUW_33250 [Streptomyces sp. NPDC101117]|uniref:hypothetical protein n=1 Tax=Streptomyces sp. NPDC101117 TaxID=3366108 RepID=UPI003808D1C0
MAEQIPMDNARLRLLAALVYKEGGHLEISHDDFLSAPDNLLITTMQNGNVVLRAPQAHERDEEGQPSDHATGG